jgi:hypothetical protein
MSKVQTLPARQEDAHTIIVLCNTVERHLREIPHGTAVTIIAKLEDIRGIAGEAFPGGFAGECEWCDEPKGVEELHQSDDAAVCNACIEAQDKKPTTTVRKVRR